MWSDVLETRLRTRREANLLRECPKTDFYEAPWISVDGVRYLGFSTNDYLALSEENAQPESEISREQSSLASTASPLVAGYRQEHRILEKAIADFVNQDDSMLFSSGYAANVGALSGLLGEDDIVFSDALNHASIIDGIRLGRSQKVVFPHRDYKALDTALQETNVNGVKVIVSESYFSMDGDCADLPKLAAIARKHAAILYIDEAHSLGLFGSRGNGLCAEANVKPDILVGTFGKSFAASGAFVASSPLIKSWLVQSARSYIFSTAPSPSLAQSLVRRLRLVKNAEEARRNVHMLASRLRTKLTVEGFDVVAGRGPIIPLVFGKPEAALFFRDELMKRGIFVQAIRPPTVPKGTSRLRITLGGKHCEEDIVRLVRAMKDIRDA